MRLPGPLIEYLINGSVAMIWIFPFIQYQFALFKDALIILVPIIYVIGMFIDLLAYRLSKIPKKKIRAKVEEKYLGKTYEDYPGINSDIKIKILTKFPELAKEIETRSGRDRIARGVIINSVFLLLFSNLILWWICVIILILSVLMWISFEYASHAFIVRAHEATKNEESKINALQ